MDSISPTARTVQVVGHFRRREFLPLWQSIEPVLWARNCRVNFGAETTFPNAAPDCFLIFQSRSGEYPSSLATALHRLNPLAPRLIFLGADCEGESRTGSPVPGPLRFYCTQWNEFLTNELDRFLRDEPSILTLPATAEDEELFLASSTSWKESTIERVGAGQPCLIVSHFGPLGNDSEMNDLLAMIYRRAQYEVAQMSPSKGEGPFKLIVADVDESPFSAILEATQRLRSDFADAEINLYINSARYNEKHDLQACGVNLIFAKPLIFPV